MEITSDPNDDGRPGDDNTYTYGDDIEVTVTFSLPVEVVASQYTRPYLRVDIAGGGARFAHYDRGSGSTALVFSASVPFNREDRDGISIIANTLNFNGKIIRRTDDPNIWANLDHGALPPDPGHKVDSKNPTLTSTETSTYGERIILTFSEDISSVTSDLSKFQVTSGVALPVTGVSISGERTVDLQMANPIAVGASVNLNVRRHSVFDLAGNGSSASGSQAVINNTIPVPEGVTATPVRFAEGEQSTMRITPPGAPFGESRTYTLVLSRTHDPQEVQDAEAAADYRVAQGGTSLTPQFRHLGNAWSHTGRQPHYALVLGAGERSMPVEVRALDDDEPEPSESMAIWVFNGADTNDRSKSNWINKRQTGLDGLIIKASDKSAVPVDATLRAARVTMHDASNAVVDGSEVTVTFNRAVLLEAHPGIHVSAWETYFLLFIGAEPVRVTQLGYKPAPGHPEGVYAESIAVSGRRLTLSFPKAVASGERVWVAYDRRSADAPLGDPLEATNPHARPPGRFAIEADNLSSSTGTALPGLSVGDAATTESGDGNDTHLSFTVTLEPASDETVTVEYQTADGSATAGDDYTAASGTLTFEPGDRQKTVRVTVHDDAVEDGGETLTVTLSKPSGATLERDEATGTINNTEAADPSELSVADAEATEGDNATLDFVVTLDPASVSTVTVDYATADGTATAGADYTVKSGTLTFDPGDTRKTISVPVAEDTAEEGAETFTLTLSNASGADLGDAEATGTIRNKAAPEPDPLTASFTGVPAEHDGAGAAFTFRVEFSEAVDTSYTVLRDEAFSVSEGGVTRARRVDGRSDLWEIAVEPDSREAVTITLPGGRACNAAGAVCTDDGRQLSNSPSATVEGPPAEPLTASFSGMPSEHDGAGTPFTFRLQFSEAPDVSYTVLRDEAFDVTGGEVRKARRVDGRDDLREIHVEPTSNGTVSIRLPATSNCNASGAICTGDGRPLSQALSATVIGPAGLSVADAEAEENVDETIDFAVTLDRAASGTVTVDYATSDGSATAGADYTAASGTLTFQAGERTKTVAVTLLDDTHDEDEETFTLTLSKASGAVIVDGEATGTIENHDPLPRALLARFGRTAAVHVVEHVEERIAAPREPGFRGRFAGQELRKDMARDAALSFLSRLGASAGVSPAGGGVHGPMSGLPGVGAASFGTPGLGGARMGMAGSMGPMMGLGAGPGALGSMRAGTGPDGGLKGRGLLDMGLGGGDILTGSAFSLNRETRSGGILSFWSRGAQSHFAGREGALSLGGDVRTTMVGADYATGPLVTGLSLSHSRGLGEYAGVTGGQVASSVTGLYPWLGYQATERVTVWGVAGYGAGGLRLTPQGGPALESGLSMAMVAAGTRGELVAGGAGGVALAFKADALWVGTSIDGVDGAAGRLAATEAAVTRFRTGLEGSRAYTLAGRLSLRPSVEVGLRHDGGDAETGAGLDVGAGLIVSDASTGLAVDVRVRTLLVHQAEGFRERGVAVSLSYTPTPSTPLGLTARVAPSWGGQATSGAEALWGRETMAGLAPGGVADGTRLDAELGYGLAVGRRFVGTPTLGVGTSAYGRDYRLGYRLGALNREALNVELGVDAQRRERPLPGGTDHGALARATLRW